MTTMWEYYEESLRANTQEAMKKGQFVGGIAYGLPIYALLVQMNHKKRKVFDGQFYYININKHILRVPHTYRADRVSIEDHYSLPPLLRLMETSLVDLEDIPEMTELKKDMGKLIIALTDLKTKYDQKDKPYQSLESLMMPCVKKIATKHNVELKSNYSDAIEYKVKIKDSYQAFVFTIQFECKEKDIETAHKESMEISPAFITWYGTFEKSLSSEYVTTPQEYAKFLPDNTTFINEKTKFFELLKEIKQEFGQYSVQQIALKRECEADIAKVEEEFKRVYNIHCAKIVNDMLLVQNFDKII